MSISYEGIGEWCATFVCGAVSEGWCALPMMWSWSMDG